MTITVALGHYGVGDLVQKAVRSILNQTFTNLHCIVIGDGEEPPLSGISDSRLDVYTLPENHGAYFALQLALLASGHVWFAPFGADDWAEPDHLERLLGIVRSKRIDCVATGALFNADGNLHTGLYEVGLYRRSRMLAIGGYNPAERIGQDTLMMRLLRLTGPLASSTVPTYHRIKRPGALTTSRTTGFGSPARNAMRARNRAIFRHCVGLRHAEAIRQYRESVIPPEVAAALSEHVEKLSARLNARAA